MISIIVPVYKAEKYLHRCVDSILAQTYQDWELLLIDDGSPDSSGDICDEYAAKDARIKVFHKPNGGVSSARNLGLDNAKGEWITFVDADDWLEENTFNIDYIDTQFDVIRIPCSFNSSGFYFDNDVVCNSRAEVDKFLSLNFCNACWGRLYKKDVIQETRFKQDIRMGEDLVFFIEIAPRISKYKALAGKIGYHYFINSESATQNLGLTADYRNMVSELYKLAKSRNNLAWHVIARHSYEIAVENNILNIFLKEVSLLQLFSSTLSFKIKAHIIKGIIRAYLK